MSRVPGFVGPPGPPDDLGVDERSCLLRAARIQLGALQGEVHRLEALPAIYGSGPMEATMAELACLARAVSWLWRHHARPPP